jgi:integrase
MAVRKIENSWRVDFSYNGIRYRIKGPENSKAGAQAYEAVLRQKLARGESIQTEPVKETPTFEKFAWKWFEVYCVPNNKYSEQKGKRSSLNSSLIPFFGKMEIQEIKEFHVEKYKAENIKKGLSRKTINNRLTVLSKCLKAAYDWQKLPGSPPKIVWLKCPPPQTRFLSPDECELLLSKSSGTLREMILLGLRSGMRQGELIGLQWSSINWENQTISVRHSQCYYTKGLVSPKSNRVRTIPMDADVYEMLFSRKRETGYVFTKKGEFIGCRGLLTHLKQVSNACGVGDIGWHTLRHTFASHLAVKGVPVPVVQALLGHASISTTMRYAHIAPSALRSAIDMLNPKSNLGHYTGTERISTETEKEIEKLGFVRKS